MAKSKLSAPQKAFFNAAFEGKTEEVRTLLAKGIPVNLPDPELFLLGMAWDTTALMYAAGEGHVETVRTLLQAKADVSIKSKTHKEDGGGESQALHFAAESRNTGVIDELLNAGADINAQGNWGRTALTIAADKGHLENIKLLLQRGARANLKSNRKSDMSPLMAAICAPNVSAEVRQEMIRALLAARADPNITGDGNRAAVNELGWAKGMPDEMRASLFQALLKAGASADHVDKFGGTALEAAVFSKSPRAVKVLAEAGADVNRVYKAGTALDIAKDNVQSVKSELADSSLDKPWRESLKAELGDAQNIVKILTAHGAKSKKQLK